MRIVQITPGAGGMYCGACLQGNTLAGALRLAGVDVTLVPVYTPLRTDEPAETAGSVFFGGINVYLQQRSALFRKLPGVLDRWLDHPALLRRVAATAGSTRPEQLGPLTVSMLRGPEGLQRKELDRLISWLEREARPELVQLSSVLLAGMAGELRRRLGVPVVSTLAGEDLFVEQLTPPYYEQARELLRQRAGELAALVAMNEYYADFMADYLAVPRERIHVIPPGLNLAGHATPDELSARHERPAAGREITIGYFSRIAPEKGLHQLAEALVLLARQAELPPVRVMAAGYLSAADRPYLEKIHTHLAQQGLAERFTYHGEMDRAGKIAFLQSLDMMCLPTVYQESKALPVLEAWANGVPAVVPDHGAFPELVADTGGGLLYQAGDAAALAEALSRLIRDPPMGVALGRRAHQAVHARYNAQQMAQRFAGLYAELLDKPSHP